MRKQSGKKIHRSEVSNFTYRGSVAKWSFLEETESRVSQSVRILPSRNVHRGRGLVSGLPCNAVHIYSDCTCRILDDP